MIKRINRATAVLFLEEMHRWQAEGERGRDKVKTRNSFNNLGCITSIIPKFAPLPWLRSSAIIIALKLSLGRLVVNRFYIILVYRFFSVSLQRFAPLAKEGFFFSIYFVRDMDFYDPSDCFVYFFFFYYYYISLLILLILLLSSL